MTTLKYKGFKILTRPYRLHESASWTVELEIRHDRRARRITVDERYTSELEADARCADIGRRIIDGRAPAGLADSLQGETLTPSILIPKARKRSRLHLAIAGITSFNFSAR
jgi:hypothetical protein